MFKKSIFFILSLCVAIVPSCQKNTSALDRAIAEYNNGQWLLAKMYAEESIEKQQQVNEASYVIGLCEFRTKRVNSAKEWFEKAAQSLNKDAQSKSQAMLGIIAESEGNHERAELLFLKAAENLDASNQRRAIGKSGKNVADIANANSSFFALQFGAFRDEKNAKTQLNIIKTDLNQRGLPKIWVQKETDSYGRTIYLVQAGQFTSRSLANSRKKQGDLPECIVVQIR